jgi:hypothetical protein
MGYPQRSPVPQSVSVTHARPIAPLSDAGAQVHVSQPFLSLSTPFGHAGSQPSCGHIGVHVRITQPHDLSSCGSQTGPPVVPSVHR